MVGLFGALVLSVSAVGCAAEQGADEAVQNQAQLGPLEDGAPADAPGIASVTALGVGCPEGSSSVWIARDGMSARVQYLRFEAAVDKKRSVDVKNCQLMIRLRNMDKYRYGVNSTVRGYAFLDNGQSATILQAVYLQGDPEDSHVHQINLVGLFDDDVRHEIAPSDAVTECGATRDLNVNTTVSLNNSLQNYGYVDLAATDGLVDSGQTIRVFANPCE